MTRSPIAGQAQTVLGPIPAEDMGITLPHEHVLIDFAVMFKEPESEPDRALARQPVRLDNLGWVRRNFSSNLDNLRLLDEQVARDELLLYRAAGGRTVVDPTNRGLARDPARARARVPRLRAQHHHGLGLLRGGLASAGHGRADGGRCSPARSSTSSPWAWARPGSARVSSARSARPGRGRPTSRRWCGRRCRRSGRPARRS